MLYNKNRTDLRAIWLAIPIVHLKVIFGKDTLCQRVHKIPGGVVTAAVCMDDAENRILYKAFRSNNESIASDEIAVLDERGKESTQWKYPEIRLIYDNCWF